MAETRSPEIPTFRMYDSDMLDMKKRVTVMLTRAVIRQIRRPFRRVMRLR